MTAIPAASAATVLRPLGVGELLDAGFALFRRLFAPLVLLQLLCGLPGLAISVYGASAGGSTDIGATLLGGLFNLALGTIGAAATSLIIGEAYLGRSLSVGEAVRRTLPRFGTLLLCGLLVGLVLLLAFLPAFAAFTSAGLLLGLGGGAADPGKMMLGAGLGLAGLVAMLLPLWVGSGVSLASIALVLERRDSAGESVARSWQLSRGGRGRIMLVFFLLLLILMLAFMGVGLVLGFLGAADATSDGPLATLGTGLLTFVLTPLFYCVLTLIYYDRRIRTEAFDLDVLAQQLG